MPETIDFHEALTKEIFLSTVLTKYMHTLKSDISEKTVPIHAPIKSYFGIKIKSRIILTARAIPELIVYNRCFPKAVNRYKNWVIGNKNIKLIESICRAEYDFMNFIPKARDTIPWESVPIIIARGIVNKKMNFILLS